MKTYTTRQGDMWDVIALRTLGNTSLTGKLYAVNGHLLDYFIFPSGVEVNIPDTQVVVTKPVATVPWR